MAEESEGALDWRRVETLFPDLLEQPVGRRDRFLDHHCGRDSALRRELESLLAAAEGDSTLDRPASIGSAQTADHPTHTGVAAGERIGAWRIVQALGRGGMGEVYLAVRAEGGFEQRAAIKLMRSDVVQHPERFAAERQILARLEHPHIARLLDGGITADGRPFMAMAYVEGRNLRDYCRQHALDLDARLALFEQVARAVAYAHANLVIHRDLKPGNILVTDAGEIRLLDFGIAKLLDPADAADNTFTAPLTPEHAAPEQLRGQPATTAVDVYALGLVLYELLAGAPPWPADTGPLSTAMQKLLGEEPPPMSRVVGKAAPVAAQLLHGDLDAIVGKCLRRSPEQRYATVDALLLDLDRWRRHEPVRARSGARSYVARRFLRRHRPLVLSGCIAAVALVAGLAVSIWQARVAQREAQRAEYQTDFLLSLFREQDPLARAQANARTPRQLIADGVAQASALAADAPLPSAELLSALGGVQLTLEEAAVSIATLERALELQQSGLEPDDVALARTRERLAGAYINVDRWADARALLEQAIPVLLRHYGDGDVRTNEARSRLARVLLGEGRRQDALDLAQQVHGHYRRSLGPNHAETLARLFNVAVLLEQSDRLDEAEQALRSCLAGLEASVGAQHLRQIYPATLLGDLLRRQGRYEEASVHLEKALAIGHAQLGTKHPRVAQIAMRLADLRRRQFRYDEALALLREAESALEASPGHLAQARLFRGGVHRDRGDYAEGEAALRQAVEGFRASMGDASPMLWQAQITLGEVLLRRSALDESERLLRSTLAANLELGERGDAMLAAGTRQTLAAVLRRRGGIVEATILDRDAVATLRTIYGDAGRPTVQAIAALALDLIAAHDAAALAEAAALLDAAGLEQAVSGDPALHARVLLTRGMIEARSGNAARADTLHEQAEALLVQLGGALADQLRDDLRLPATTG